MKHSPIACKSDRFLPVFLFVISLLAVTACSVTPKNTDAPVTVKQQPDATQSMLDEFSVRQDNAGVVALVVKQGIARQYAAGLADRSNQKPAQTTDLFQIGSASKMFTAVAIFQLIEAGKLSFDTPVSQFFNSPEYRKLGQFKGKNYWDKITVAMLLNHTSGMIDYLNIYGDDAKALKIFGVRGTEYTTDDLVKLASKFGDAHFIPGEQWAYSNTGYILLGDIISKVSGQNWHDYIRTNIFTVADMDDTWFGSRISSDNRAREMQPYYQSQPTYMPPSLAGSAGEIISNLDDLGKFLRVWVAGEFYRDPATIKLQLSQSYQQMYPGVDLIKYGYGLMLMKGFYGHGGQTFGFQSYIATKPETGELYVLGINDANASSMELFAMLLTLSAE